MAFDIYGNILEKGFCEVHPWVKEEFPCTLCMCEKKTRDEKRNVQHEISAEWHAAMIREHYESIGEKSSLKYRLLCNVEFVIGRLYGMIKEHKEKLFQKIVQKYESSLKNKKDGKDKKTTGRI